MKLKQLFLLCIVSLSSYFSFGQSPTFIAAADLTYTCVGANRFNFTLEIYAECGSEFGNLVNRASFSLPFFSESLQQGGEFAVIKPSAQANGEEIKIFCDQNPSNCTNANGDRGLTKYTYSGILDLNSFQRAEDWTISWQRNLRGFPLSSTLLNIDQEPFYTEVIINNQATSCNNSPVFNSGDRGPIVRACSGEEETYRLNASDNNNDELRYSIRQPRGTSTDPVVYRTGFDSLRPISLSTPLQINNQGDLTINATTADQHGITDILIEEYRNGVFIGSVRRCIQISTFTCDNQRPELLGFNGSSDFELSFCVGDTLNRTNATIPGTDPDDDNARITLLPPITNSDGTALTRNIFFNSSTTLNPEAFIQWVPTLADTGTYTINVQIEDEGCPTPRTNNASYEISILSPPVFDLGPNTIFECNSPFNLEPDVVVSAAPASFYWVSWELVERTNPTRTEIVVLDTLSQETSYFVDRSDSIGLIVTDAIGCTTLDTVIFINSLNPDFTWSDYCFGLETIFEDRSATAVGDLVSWEWDFGENGATALGDSVSYQFSAPGDYDVTLTVTNSVGCTEIITQTVTICDRADVNIGSVGDCSLEDGTGIGVILYDSTDYEPFCGSGTRIWQIYDSTQFGSIRIDSFNTTLSTINVQFSDSGNYVIELITESESGCIDSARKPLYINPRPQFELLQTSPFSINCNSPDTLLQAIFLPDQFGSLPLQYTNNDGITVIVSPTDTLDFLATETGQYRFFVEDDSGCTYQQSLVIEFPIQTRFAYDTVCREGNPMQFTDQSVSSNPILDWQWDFGGDGTSNDQNPQHIFSTPGDYNVTLTATDSRGCSNSYTLECYNTFPIDTFSVVPDVLVQRVCVRDLVTGNTARPNTITGSHIDTIGWDYGLGLRRYYDQLGYPFPLSSGYEIPISYNQVAPFTVFNYVSYNSHPGVHNNFCRIENTLPVEIDVAPEFNGEIIDNRVCIGDSAEFFFDRTINNEIPLDSTFWTFTRQGDIIPFATSTDFEPTYLILDSLFQENQEINIELRAVDINGCIFNGDATASIRELPQGNMTFENALCANDNVEINLFSVLSRDIDLYYVIDGRNGDTIFYDPTYEVVDPSTGFFGSANYNFNEAGEHPITLFLVESFPDETGFVKECRSVSDTVLELFHIPEVRFTATEVCAIDEETVFTNASTIAERAIDRYLWDFGDDSTSTEENPSHIFRNGGIQSVTLTATSETGCENALTQNVYVRHKPTAGFFFDPEFPEANNPLSFFDDSEYGPTGADQSWYIFGDGSDTAFAFDPVHIYDSVDVYQVLHAVSNQEGCWDTTSVRTDLNVYLDLPTAFSPNNDGNNDGLRLIHKSIKSLIEYKIYNRWGELIFDGGNNLDAIWDGTYNGQDQPLGVYVAHVKAIGAYDTEFFFKKNVTLIR